MEQQYNASNEMSQPLSTDTFSTPALPPLGSRRDSTALKNHASERSEPPPVQLYHQSPQYQQMGQQHQHQTQSQLPNPQPRSTSHANVNAHPHLHPHPPSHLHSHPHLHHQVHPQQHHNTQQHPAPQHQHTHSLQQTQPHQPQSQPQLQLQSLPGHAAKSEPQSVNSSSDSRDKLEPLSKVDETTGRKYILDVAQQPRRARMCGFGDKDRRPITPPPCVRLIITDIVTGKEIDCNDIDHTMFVLNVDLWDEHACREVNLVRSSSSTTSPSASSTNSYPYATINGGDTASVSYPQHIPSANRDPSYNSSHAVGYTQDYQIQSGYGQATPSYPSSNNSYAPTQQYFVPHQAYRPDGVAPSLASQTGVATFARNGPIVSAAYPQEQSALTRMAMVSGPPQGMFTRNLIGSLAASAFRLSDTTDRIGIWFVLQDLSVRTEGPFRLRFSFVNVGPRGGALRDDNSPVVNTGRAPILASCFSEVFHVYSAKKFPGVCESTPLSKTFATQGIKIPIRKDANLKGGDGEDEYGD